MSKLGTWSTTAGNNNTTPPDGWPEGQAPSTVNDCAREMMASIRTAFSDLLYVDQGMSPTYISASSFSVPGSNASSMHIGRRLKVFDATAGAGTVLYATVVNVSASAASTVVHVSMDSGVLTASLSSFAISILSNNSNNGIPQGMALTLSALVVSGATRLENLSVSAINATGPVHFATTVSCSATLASRQVLGAWIRFEASAGTSTNALWNVGAVSRSAAGVYRITFSTAFTDANYGFHINAYAGDGSVRAVEHVSIGTTAILFRTRDVSASVKDATMIVASFFR